MAKQQMHGYVDATEKVGDTLRMIMDGLPLPKSERAFWHEFGDSPDVAPKRLKVTVTVEREDPKSYIVKGTES